MNWIKVYHKVHLSIYNLSTIATTATRLLNGNLSHCLFCIKDAKKANTWTPLKFIHMKNHVKIHKNTHSYTSNWPKNERNVQRIQSNLKWILSEYVVQIYSLHISNKKQQYRIDHCTLMLTRFGVVCCRRYVLLPNYSI